MSAHAPWCHAGPGVAIAATSSAALTIDGQGAILDTAARVQLLAPSLGLIYLSNLTLLNPCVVNLAWGSASQQLFWLNVGGCAVCTQLRRMQHSVAAMHLRLSSWRFGIGLKAMLPVRPSPLQRSRLCLSPPMPNAVIVSSTTIVSSQSDVSSLMVCHSCAPGRAADPHVQHCCCALAHCSTTGSYSKPPSLQPRPTLAP